MLSMKSLLNSNVRTFTSAFITRPVVSTRFIRALQVEDFSSSGSWMDKNKDFQRFDSMAKNFRFEGAGGNEKQRQRRQNKRKEEYNQKKDIENQTFRNNFRGTRVFVQGLPEHIGWKELKDHFKQVGDVVFASVSVDANTGRSKCCGIVQFENTDIASKAIEVMRDFKARDNARRRKEYEASDKIRDQLKNKYSVHLDDRLKMFWISPDNVVPKTINEIKGEGRWGDEKPWRQIPTTPENDACVNPDLVNALLKQRDIARKEKDFTTADALLEEAKTSPDGDLELRIHDESRTWRIWTAAPPPKEIYERTATYANYERPIKRNLTPAEECIALVMKHEPNKLDDVKMLLSKFPGREYNILKKLKENYES